MGFKKINSKVFYKYFLSYLFIFSIPLVILGIIFYNNAVLNLKSEIEQSNINKLNQIKEIIDSRNKELERIATMMSFDHRLTPFMVRSGGYYTKEAINELQKYKANSSIIKELFLYIREDQMIYSSTGSYSLETLATSSYRFGNWEKAHFIEDLNTIKFPEIRPAEKVLINGLENNNMLTYLFPLSRNNSYPYATAMFLIDESMLTSLIDSTLRDFNGSVYIFDAKMNVLASKNIETSIPLSEIKRITKNDSENVKKLKFDNKKYSMLTVKSTDSEWTFVSTIPSEQLFDKASKMQMTVIKILFFLLLIGLLVAIFLSIKNYRPIRDLAEHAFQYLKYKKGEQGKNELERIRETIDAINSDNQVLLLQMDRHKLLAREQFLYKLINGSFENITEVENLTESHDLSFQRSNYFTLLISCRENNKNEMLWRKMLERTMTINFPNGIGYGFELVQNSHDNMIAMIINIECDCRSVQEESALYLLSIFQENGILKPVISVGKTYECLSHINRSFIEASAAMEYCFIHHKYSMIFFDDIKNLHEQTSWYPIEEQVKFVQSLKQGDIAVAKESLKVMINSITEREQSVLMLKYKCIDVINSVFKMITEMNMNDYSSHAKKLLEYDSLEEFEILLHSLAEEICHHVQRNKESSNLSLCKNILEYINIHYRSYDLSLESVAEHFQLSISYLSRFMKDQTGESFTDYVFNLKMNEVKRQLKNSDKLLKDIVSDIGYINVSSFNRKFKKIEGVTAGEYRKLIS